MMLLNFPFNSPLKSGAGVILFPPRMREGVCRPWQWDGCVTTIRMAARIASPEMLPKDLSLPQLKCSPAVDNRGSRDEAGEHGDQE